MVSVDCRRGLEEAGTRPRSLVQRRDAVLIDPLEHLTLEIFRYLCPLSPSDNILAGFGDLAVSGMYVCILW
jgi:hypothetical protein